MQDDQKKFVDQLWARRAASLPIHSPYELVTLASIVEKETGKADERPHVASVFLNRLAKHMRLQSDPTIVYGLVGGKGTLGAASWTARSKSRRPTTPIRSTDCRRGRSPIRGGPRLRRWPIPRARKISTSSPMEPAAMSSAETLDQHNRNVQRWRAMEKDAKDKAGAGGDVDKASLRRRARRRPERRAAPAGAAHGGQHGEISEPGLYLWRPAGLAGAAGGYGAAGRQRWREAYGAGS